MSPGFLPVATLDGARAAPVGATRLVARAMEMFDALRSAAPACDRRHSIALCGIARAGIAPRAHTQCCRGNGADLVASSSEPRGRRPGGGILRAGRRGGVTPMPATRWPRALLLLGRVRWISRRCVACAQWPCWDMRLAEWRWAESVGWTGGDTAARAIFSERSQLARYTTLQTFFVLRSSLVRPVVCRRAGIAQVRHQDLL